MKRFFLTSVMLLLVIFSTTLLAQDRIVTGKVTGSDDGLPLPQVSVFLKGTTTGAPTNVDGEYRISVPATGGTLVFRYLGYLTQEVEVGNQTVINIVMTPDATSLGEVVVTALGITREQSKLGYSVQQVSADDIKNSARTNVIDALNGKVSGVQINNAGGQVGGGTNVIIRGMTSLNYSNQPLFIVDGVPIDNSAQFNSLSGTTSANRAVDLNPEEIESVTVLKGGSATALYGIRAANGAILITTKKGAQGTGLNLEYSFSRSLERVNQLHETNSDFTRGRNGAYSNVTHWSWGPAYASNPTFPAGTTLDLDGDGTTEDVGGQAIPRYPNNYERFWQDGFSTNHNLALSGGGERNAFYVSFGRLNSEGISPGNEYERNSFLVNVSQDINDRLTVSAKANYINTGGRRYRTATGILEGLGYWHTMWDVNSYPWKDTNGNKTWFSNGVPHPLWIVKEEGEDWNLNRLIANVSTTYKVSDWINFAVTAGIDVYNEKRLEVRPLSSVNTASNLGDMTDLRLTNKDINVDAIVRGNGLIGKDFDISYLAGFNLYRTNYDRQTATGITFVLPEFYNVNNTVTQQASTFESAKMLVGVYADISVGWRDMLYFGITGRNDWSSTLPLDNNSFFYPSVNLGFVASEIMNNSFISFLKFRASYAETANDAPINALNDTFSSQTPNIFGLTRFTTSNSKQNPNLKPERTQEYEFGFDARFFDNRVSLDMAYYRKKSLDQIFTLPLSNATGYTSRLVNLGEVSNKGVEAILTINNPIKARGVEWSTSFNFTKNVGEVEKLGPGVDRLILANGWWSSVQAVAFEGAQLGALYGYPYARYGVDADDPDFLSAPLLVDPTTGTPARNGTRILMGNATPDWILGITTSASFKNFDAGFTIDRRQGGDIVNGFKANLAYSGLAVETAERWYADEDPYANARKDFNGVDSNGSPVDAEAPLTNNFYSSVWRNVDENLIEDGSWWKLRNAFVGYTLRSSLLDKTPFQSINIRFSAKNIIIHTDYSGNDPELSAHGVGNVQGFDELVVPGSKSFEISARVKFK